MFCDALSQVSPLHYGLVTLQEKQGSVTKECASTIYCSLSDTRVFSLHEHHLWMKLQQHDYLTTWREGGSSHQALFLWNVLLSFGTCYSLSFARDNLPTTWIHISSEHRRDTKVTRSAWMRMLQIGATSELLIKSNSNRKHLKLNFYVQRNPLLSSYFHKMMLHDKNWLLREDE